ncbi:ATP-binding cassette domain-containing protein [Spirochaetales bacterium NM-380-WT-3C1]|uniref:ATP-binding cassette domain-containing protein n=1 Tax=Bullifex porci TaxID=2606638 RepID=A0A7X2TR61_9SPIO|nr:ATP-binding cassette domain-containing protein [Bullifex porci]
MFSFLGSSGAGKRTLTKLMLGLLRNYNGTITLTYSHGQAHGNLAMVTTAAPQRASCTVSGPRDPSGLAL